MSVRARNARGDGKPKPYRRVPREDCCPYCGMAYEDFRSARVPSFREAASAVWNIAQQLAERGDYSKPCKRTGVLGYMRGAKLAAWREDHLHPCGEAAGVCSERECLDRLLADLDPIPF